MLYRLMLFFITGNLCIGRLQILTSSICMVTYRFRNIARDKHHPIFASKFLGIGTNLTVNGNILRIYTSECFFAYRLCGYRYSSFRQFTTIVKCESRDLNHSVRQDHGLKAAGIKCSYLNTLKACCIVRSSSVI